MSHHFWCAARIVASISCVSNNAHAATSASQPRGQRDCNKHINSAQRARKFGSAEICVVACWRWQVLCACCRLEHAHQMGTHASLSLASAIATSCCTRNNVLSSWSHKSACMLLRERVKVSHHFGRHQHCGATRAIKEENGLCSAPVNWFVGVRIVVLPSLQLNERGFYRNCA